MSATIIDSLLIELGFRGDQAIDGLIRVENATVNINNQVTRVNHNLNEMGAIVGKVRNQALLLLSAFTAGKGLSNFIGDTITGVTNLKYLSENLGVSTESITQWRLAAEQAGSSGEAMAAMLAQANAEFIKIKTQGGAGTFLQNASPISFFTQGGDFSKLDSSLGIIIEKSRLIKQAFDSGIQGQGAAVAESLGVTPETVNLLKQGPDALLKLLNAQKLNAVVAKDEADAMQQLDAQLKTLSATYSRTGTQVLIDLIPAMEGMTHVLQELGNWIASHRSDISRFFDTNIKKLGDFLKPFLENPERISQTFDRWSTRADNFATKLEKIVGFAERLIGLSQTAVLKTQSFFGDESADEALNDMGEKPFWNEGTFLEEKLNKAAIKYKFNYEDVKDAFKNAGKKYMIDPNLLMAQAYHESKGFNPNAVSPAGAIGISQIMPLTGMDLGLGAGELRDPVKSIFAQAKYMRQNLDKFKNNTDLGLAAYNAGPRAVEKYGNKVPPYPETQKYLKLIHGYYDQQKSSIANNTQSTHINTVNITADGNKSLKTLLSDIISPNSFAGQMAGGIR